MTRTLPALRQVAFRDAVLRPVVFALLLTPVATAGAASSPTVREPTPETRPLETFPRVEDGPAAGALPEARAPGSVDVSPPPTWFLEHNDFLTRDGGVFHTDNGAWVSEAEPWEAYGLAWEKGPSGMTVRGRLFAIRDGVDAGTFWEFFVYWDPHEGRAHMRQVGGDATLGKGVLEPPAPDGSQRSEEAFLHLDGSVRRLAHVVHNAGDVHETASFDWVDGGWVPRRTYVWHRVRGEEETATGG